MKHTIASPIKVGHSALFRTVDGLRSRLQHSSAPLELVFSAREDEWGVALSLKDEIVEVVRDSGREILSVHAPPLEMDGADFPDTALRFANLVERVGASTLTLHPSKCMKPDQRLRRQAAAFENIRRAQKTTSVVLAVETLSHQKCLFTADEIVSFHLPMVLDTTHVGWIRAHDLLARYKGSIVTIHLSDITDQAQHQPVGASSFEFVAHLLENEWHGNAVLEYWPWRWDHYAHDVAAVREFVNTQEAAGLRAET